MKFLKCILLVLALSITFAGGMPAGTLFAQEAGQVPPEPLARSAELFSRAATALEERSISPKTSISSGLSSLRFGTPARRS